MYEKLIDDSTMLKKLLYQLISNNIQINLNKYYTLILLSKHK